MNLRRVINDDVLASILIAEELANLTKTEEPKINTKEVIKLEQCTTRTYRYENKRVYRDLNLISIKGRGELNELSIITNNKNYVFRLIVDNYMFFDETWDELNSLSTISDYLDASTTPENYYLLRLSETKFKENLKITIIPANELRIIQGIAVITLCE